MAATHGVHGYHHAYAAKGLVLYWLLITVVLLVALLVILAYPDRLPDRPLWFAIGLIGLWRYAWKSCHAVRAFYYQTIHYPRLQAMAASAVKPSQLLVIVTTYQTDALVSYRVYQRLFDELERFGVDSEVAACISDPSDMAVINRAKGHRKITVHFLPQDGQGKRVAMVSALQLFLNEGCREDAQLVLMDGDSVVSAHIFDRCCRFVAKFENLGGLTCDNEPIVKGGELTRLWYQQRMAMRHFYMNSLSLSHRLLVLTGRFSLFKANILINREFIHILEHDIIDHWRYGRLRMLTGDDKSTWFYLLRQGWSMLFLPDVRIYCLEEEVAPNFFRSSASLMIRWFGNMLRNNGRAMGIGPKTCGVFLWCCLLDQKVSMWTTLSGPVFILLLSWHYSMTIWAIYAMWVILVRGAVCVMNWLLTGKFHPAFILLLWYEQVVGSMLKVYTLFRLDRQKWTRQSISARRGNHHYWVHTLLPRMMTLASMLTLFISLALYQGILRLSLL